MKLSLFLLLLGITFACHAQSIIPAQAKKHMGDIITVCGEVTSAQSSQDLEQRPTVLGFGPVFPSEDFSIVIFEKDIDAFNYNPRDLVARNVCVTGEIVKLFGRPSILVSDPSQIEEKNN